MSKICDIDIIDFNRRSYQIKLNKNDNLYIPHKMMHKREFVLLPMKEVSPKWVHPIKGQKISVLIKKLPFRKIKSITKISFN